MRFRMYVPIIGFECCCFSMAHRGKQNKMNLKPNKFLSGRFLSNEMLAYFES